MSERIARERLVALLHGDQEILDHLCDLGVLEVAADFDPAQVEVAIVARTLVRELEVNWPGVEVILRMRTELCETRDQVADLLCLLGRGGER